MSSSPSPWQISLRASRLQSKKTMPACRERVRKGCRVYSVSEHSARLKDSRLLSRRMGIYTRPIEDVYRCEQRPWNNTLSRAVIDISRGGEERTANAALPSTAMFLLCLIRREATRTQTLSFPYAFLRNSFEVLPAAEHRALKGTACLAAYAGDVEASGPGGPA